MATGEFGPSGFVQTYPAVPASVATIRRALSQFARELGGPSRLADAVAVAASEAATNVVMHAYRDRPEPGLIEVSAARTANELVVAVRDHGPGLTPRVDSPGLGLGLAIIAQQADRLDLLDSPTGGLEVRMYFALPAPPQ
jgi:serine/threonine-protein kinase RsbW